MIEFLVQYWGTIVVSAFVIVLIAAAIIVLRRRHKRGGSGCGCGCSHCSARCSEHQEQSE